MPPSRKSLGRRTWLIVIPCVVFLQGSRAVESAVRDQREMREMDVEERRLRLELEIKERERLLALETAWVIVVLTLTILTAVARL